MTEAGADGSEGADVDLTEVPVGVNKILASG
jgi:hypothetical protein